jgi:hypothetical protein
MSASATASATVQRVAEAAGFMLANHAMRLTTNQQAFASQLDVTQRGDMAFLVALPGAPDGGTKRILRVVANSVYDLLHTVPGAKCKPVCAILDDLQRLAINPHDIATLARVYKSLSDLPHAMYTGGVDAASGVPMGRRAVGTVVLREHQPSGRSVTDTGGLHAFTPSLTLALQRALGDWVCDAAAADVAGAVKGRVVYHGDEATMHRFVEDKPIMSELIALADADPKVWPMLVDMYAAAAAAAGGSYPRAVVRSSGWVDMMVAGLLPHQNQADELHPERKGMEEAYHAVAQKANPLDALRSNHSERNRARGGADYLNVRREFHFDRPAVSMQRKAKRHADDDEGRSSTAASARSSAGAAAAASASAAVEALGWRAGGSFQDSYTSPPSAPYGAKAYAAESSMEY